MARRDRTLEPKIIEWMTGRDWATVQEISAGLGICHIETVRSRLENMSLRGIAEWKFSARCQKQWRLSAQPEHPLD